MREKEKGTKGKQRVGESKKLSKPVTRLGEMADLQVKSCLLTDIFVGTVSTSGLNSK